MTTGLQLYRVSISFTFCISWTYLHSLNRCTEIFLYFFVTGNSYKPPTKLGVALKAFLAEKHSQKHCCLVVSDFLRLVGTCFNKGEKTLTFGLGRQDHFPFTFRLQGLLIRFCENTQPSLRLNAFCNFENPFKNFCLLKISFRKNCSIRTKANSNETSERTEKEFEKCDWFFGVQWPREWIVWMLFMSVNLEVVWKALVDLSFLPGLAFWENDSFYILCKIRVKCKMAQK